MPTAREVGLPELTLEFWAGVLAPAGTPPEIVGKLNAAINETLAVAGDEGQHGQARLRRQDRLAAGFRASSSPRKFRAGPTIVKATGVTSSEWRSATKIVIIGGGIGGLAAALSLLKRGLDVEVHEQAPELKEVGAGIQISSNGTRVLYALGLEEALKRVQVLPSRRVIRHWSTRRDLELVRSRRDHARNATARRTSCCTGATCTDCWPTRCARQSPTR